MSFLADLAMVVLAVGMVILLGLGVAGSARREGRDAAAAPRLGLTVAFVLVLWLVGTGLLASTGALTVWTARPPRWPLLPLTALVTMVALTRTSLARELIAATPPVWPIAAQSFRIGVELTIFALHEAGRAPVQITFEGRNFDILVGLSAPLIAWLVARGRLAPGLVVLWNALGLAVLASTVRTIATSTPGPLHLDWSGAPFTAIATWPVVWLPAFLAPLAVLLHLVSLGQTVHAIRGRRALSQAAARSGH